MTDKSTAHPILHPNEVDAIVAQFHAWGTYSMSGLCGSISLADWAKAEKDRYLAKGESND